MAYKSIDLQQLNSLLREFDWDADIMINNSAYLMQIDIENIITIWESTRFIVGGHGVHDNLTMFGIETSDIVGAYTTDESEIKNITVDVMGGYLMFRKVVA